MGQTAWSDALSVGIDLIDEQHKMFISKLNDLSAAVEAHQGQSAISGTLGFLIEYADFHFKEEEKHMAEQGYPGLEQQVAEHEAFRKTLANIEADFLEDGATHELAGDIDTLLVNWFINHIKSVDKQLGDYLRANGIILIP